MPNVARHRRGLANAKRFRTNSADNIHVGDHIVQVSGKATLPSTLVDAGTTAQNQQAAHLIYAGVSQDAKPVGLTNDISVATTGVHKFTCAALGQAYEVGQFFGLAGTGAALAVGVSDTDVVPVATANLAIGTLAEHAAAGATTVDVDIAGVVSTTQGGTQTPPP